MTDVKLKDPNDQTQDDQVTTPLDPTDNFAGMINDTSGLTGISSDTNSNDTPPQNTGPVSRTMSDAMHEHVTDTALGRDAEDENSNRSNSEFRDTREATGNEVLDDVKQPHVRDQYAPSGTMPDPASDDDVDGMLNEVGLPSQSENNPEELDIASKLDQAEIDRHNH